jgi:hypothetical protein
LKFGEIGGDNVKVFLNAMGVPLPKADKLSGNAEERCLALVELLRKLEAKWQFLENDIPDEKVMMDSDTHAFTLDLENQYIRPWIESKKSVPDLIEEKLRKPVKAITESSIDESQKKELLESSKRLVPDEFQGKFNENFTSLQECCTVGSFAKALLDLIFQMNPGIREEAENHSFFYK